MEVFLQRAYLDHVFDHQDSWRTGLGTLLSMQPVCHPLDSNFWFQVNQVVQPIFAPDCSISVHPREDRHGGGPFQAIWSQPMLLTAIPWKASATFCKSKIIISYKTRLILPICLKFSRQHPWLRLNLSSRWDWVRGELLAATDKFETNGNNNNNRTVKMNTLNKTYYKDKYYFGNENKILRMHILTRNCDSKTIIYINFKSNLGIKVFTQNQHPSYNVCA